MAILFFIYCPTAAVGYFSLGDCVKSNIIMNMSNGGLKITAECTILVHLFAAVPIAINPPNQYFEKLLNIPNGKFAMTTTL